MMRITITQRDITRAKKECKLYPGNESFQCPIGQYMRRNKMFQHYLFVGPDIIQLDDEIFNLPQVAQDFIWRFDNGYSLKPFNFILR